MEKVREFLRRNYNTLTFFLKNTALATIVLLSLHYFQIWNFRFFISPKYLILFLFILLLTYLLCYYEKKEIQQDIIIQKCSKYVFITGVFLLTFFSIKDPSIIEQVRTPFLSLTIFSGFLIFYFEKENKVQSTKIIKPLFIITIILFVLMKIAIPIIYQGNFIDEYFHILSGIEFFKSGKFPELYYNAPYTRGAMVSVSVGFFIYLFGQTIFVAKMLPALLGIVNFFLLYKIAQKIFNNQNYILLLLLIYTFAPWFLFNHFYVRMYVFYEFFILLLTFLFFLTIQNSKKTKPFITYLLIIVSILTLIYFFMNDNGMYMILLYAFLFLTYIFFFEIQKLDIKNKFLQNQNLKAATYIISTIVIFITLEIFDLIGKFTSGEILYTTALQLKYDNLFFNKNIFFSIFFLISIPLIFNKKTNIYGKTLITFSLVLFAIHYNASLDLQITRAIIYFLPLFFLVSIFSISRIGEIFKNKRNTAMLLSLGLLSMTGMYTHNFFSYGPNLPTDVDYREYKEASLKTHEIADENTVVLTHFPHIYNFFNKQKEYEVYLLRDNEYSFHDYKQLNMRYTKEDKFFYDSFSGERIITDPMMLLKLLQSNDIILLLDRGVTHAWVTQDSQTILSKKFVITHIFGDIAIYQDYEKVF